MITFAVMDLYRLILFDAFLKCGQLFFQIGDHLLDSIFITFAARLTRNFMISHSGCRSLDGADTRRTDQQFATIDVKNRGVDHRLRVVLIPFDDISAGNGPVKK